jgi:hypothetical protein
MGYHYEMENKPVSAKEARFKALVKAHVMLSDNEHLGKEKELLYIIATMNYFTGQERAAFSFLDRAIKYKYENHDVDNEVSEGINNRLTLFISDYPIFIEENKKLGKISSR